MIPLRVRMTGWMRFVETQEADFEGPPLIAICGPNGAGKSAIFDGILFALFGEHRLGKHNTEDLIPDDAGRVAIEFEFEAGAQRFLVRRGRSKAAMGEGEKRRSGEPERGMWQWDESQHRWVAVPGTEREDGLERAVRRVVRISAEAYKSSFLLQQDRATEFIDADPKDRFKIIGSLIGLEEYERLEQRARDRRLETRTQLKDARTRLDQEFAGATEEALCAKEEALSAAKTAEEAAIASHAAAQERLRGSREFARLTGELAGLEREIERAEVLVAGKKEIEAAARRYQELEALASALAEVDRRLRGEVELRGQAAACRRQAEAIDVGALQAAERAQAAAVVGVQGRVQERSAARDAAQRKRDETTRLRTAAEQVLEQRRRLEQLSAEAERLASELAELPALQDQLARLRRVAAALPHLRNTLEHRRHLEALAAGDPVSGLARARREMAGLEERLLALEEARAAAGAERDVSLARVARIRAGVEALSGQVKQREASIDEGVCSRCGQPVDAVLASEQVAVMKEELGDLRAQLKSAEADAGAAADKERGVADDLTAHGERRHKLVVEIARLEGLVEQLRRAGEEATREQGAFVERAPRDLGSRVKAESPLTELASLLGEYGAVDAQTQEVEERVRALTLKEGQLERAIGGRREEIRRLAALEAGLGERLADVERAAALDDAAERELAAADEAFRAALETHRTLQQAQREAMTALEKGRGERGRLEQEAAVLEERATSERRLAEQHLSGLDEEGAGRALFDPQGELRRVEAEKQELAGAPQRLQAVLQAERDLAGLRAAAREKGAGLGRIPQEHHVPVEDAARLETETAAAEDRARREREHALQERTRLADRIDEANRLRLREGQLQRQLRLLTKLVDLLGRSGVQGVLITEALTSITSHANGFLEKLTGGSLRLQLDRAQRPSRGDEQIELRALDATCMRQPRPVKSLSGSQKFRVAVAIASGIGQYAGTGGMRSIIIDEGFGSLDFGSQRQMVAELKELANHMDKVIVVSHLEAFANEDDFPTRLMVERRDGTSTIRRVG